MDNINVVLFNDFTLLDAIGPVEVFKCVKDSYRVQFYSQFGGRIKTDPDLDLLTQPFSEIKSHDVLLIPGGLGTRVMVKNENFINQLHELVYKSSFVLTVCTGSALLAKTGLLSNHKATSNKKAFDWVMEQDRTVIWIKKARWVVDGKYYTSAGVSAGIDMALGFLKDNSSYDLAKNVAKTLEYVWNEDRDQDFFG